MTIHATAALHKLCCTKSGAWRDFCDGICLRLHFFGTGKEFPTVLVRGNEITAFPVDASVCVSVW